MAGCHGNIVHVAGCHGNIVHVAGCHGDVLHVYVYFSVADYPGAGCRPLLCLDTHRLVWCTCIVNMNVWLLNMLSLPVIQVICRSLLRSNRHLLSSYDQLFSRYCMYNISWLTLLIIMAPFFPLSSPSSSIPPSFLPSHLPSMSPSLPPLPDGLSSQSPMSENRPSWIT